MDTVGIGQDGVLPPLPPTLSLESLEPVLYFPEQVLVVRSLSMVCRALMEEEVAAAAAAAAVVTVVAMVDFEKNDTDTER